MVDVSNKMCEHLGCETRANYNVHGSKRGKLCAVHKQTDMVNVKKVDVVTAVKTTKTTEKMMTK